MKDQDLVVTGPARRGPVVGMKVEGRSQCGPAKFSLVIRPRMRRLARGYVPSSSTPPKMTGGTLGRHL